MCGSMVDIQSPTAEIRRGKKRRRRNHSMEIYIWPALSHRAAIKKLWKQLITYVHYIVRRCVAVKCNKKWQQEVMLHVTKRTSHIIHTNTTIFGSFFWAFMVQGKINRQTHWPSGWAPLHPEYSVAHLHHPPIFMPDSLPAWTLSLYPGLGQAPNMLVCIPSGVINHMQYYLINRYLPLL